MLFYGRGNASVSADFPLKFWWLWSLVIQLDSLKFVGLPKVAIVCGQNSTASPIGSVKRAVMPRRRTELHHHHMLVLPRIPVKPCRNATVTTALPYRPRPPMMGWHEYLKEVGSIESPKCGTKKKGQTPPKLDGKKQGKTKQKNRKKKKDKKERVVESKMVEGGEERKRKKPFLVPEEMQRKLPEGEEEEVYYRYEGVGNLQSCRGHFVRCRPSRECTSGTLCYGRMDGELCCRRHADAQCPDTDRLGYACRQKNPVNWCNFNSDCATNALHSHICCPTGCGYNICLSNVGQSPISRIGQMEAQTRLMSPDCPNPFKIRIKCVVPRPVSWCYSARECPTFSKAYPRRCCLTSCGYNVCMTKFGDNGWIIA